MGSAKTPGWSLCVWWVVATTVGWVAGLGVGQVVSGVVSGIMSAVMFGIVVGVLQWLVLRRQMARAGWWVVASVVGWLVGWLVAWGGFGIVSGGGFVGGGFVGEVVSEAVGWVVVVGLGPVVSVFVVGVLQWLVLRRQVARAGWWVVANVVGLGVFVVASGFIMITVDLVVGFVGTVVSEVVGMAMYGVITGIVLVQLLRQRAGDADDAASASE